MKSLTGIVFIACGALMLIMFKRFIVDPAYTPLPGGGYGELFGPVSFFRIPVYILCGLCMAIGVVLLAAFFQK